MRKVWKFAAAAVMACALCVSTVSALGSITKNGAISDTIVIDGKEVEKGSMKAEFKTEFTTEEVEQVVVDAIKTLNENPAQLQEVLKNANVQLPSGDGVTLAHVDLLTSVQNLQLVDKDGNVIKDAKNVTMTWEVPNMSEQVGVIRVLHFSTTRNVWELLIPDSVDFTNKTITVTFPDLSPVAVVYVPKDKVDEIDQIADYKDGSKPGEIIKDTSSESSSSSLLFYGMSALVLVGAVAFGYRRKMNTK